MSPKNPGRGTSVRDEREGTGLADRGEVAMHSRLRALMFLVLIGLMGLARPASAQSTIAGLVTDTTGAVLPGVTVEASSPALIEKVRTAATDTQGRYSIVDIRPGVYTVS